MNNEIWKDIIGFEGLYQVSNLGRVRSLDRTTSHNCFIKGKILKTRIHKDYVVIQLSEHNKCTSKQVHRLVAETFLENPNNLPQVNHKDENPLNNVVENLEWCDAKYNNNYGNHIQKTIDTKVAKGYWDRESIELNKMIDIKIDKNDTKAYAKAYHKAYNEIHKEKISARHKAYYEANKEKILARQKAYRKSKK